MAEASDPGSLGNSIQKEKMHRFRQLLCALLCLPLQAFAWGETPLLHKFVALGTASTNGVYHPVGVGICQLVNEHRLLEQIRCLAYSTGGSVYNVKSVLSGELDIGITRTDLVFDAFYGRGDFAAAGPAPSLRMLGTLYDEPVVVLARRASGVTELGDIRGKRVNIGNRGSSQRNIVNLLLEAMNLRNADFAAVSEFATDAMGDAFCKGEVDVIVQALGMPAPFYQRMIEQCDGVVVRIPKAVIDRITLERPTLARITIPGGIYAGHPETTESIGFRTALVASERLSEETVYRVLRTLTSQIEDLKEKHPTLARLTVKAMSTDGITIPLHPGAARLYQEIAEQ